MRIYAIPFLISISVMITAGCAQKREAQEEKQEQSENQKAFNLDSVNDLTETKLKSVIEETQYPIDSAFHYLSEIQKEDITTNTLEAFSLYCLGKVDLSDSERVDELFLTFTEFQYTAAQALDDKLAEEDPARYDQVQDLGIEGQKTTKSADDYVTLMLAKGYRMVIVEGSVQFVPSISYALGFFSRYLTKPTKAYFVQIMAEEQAQLVDDGGILVSPKELADRVGFRSAFIHQYPNHPLAADDGMAKSEYEVLLSYFVLGLDNTPTFDHTDKLIDSYLEAYRYAAAKYKGTTFGRLMGEYAQVLEQEDYTKTEKVKEFVREKLNLDKS